ncbi:MAG: hypothetical protein HW402_340 [Dehalococcoidales bacterium]|nr:hypothetical protein [Dehalococcoidales bacterium]
MRHLFIQVTSVYLVLFLLTTGCVVKPPPNPDVSPIPPASPVVLDISFPDGAPLLNHEARLAVKVTVRTFGVNNMSVNVSLPDAFQLVSGNLSWVGDIARGDKVTVEAITAVVRAVKTGNWTIDTLFNFDPGNGFRVGEGGGHYRVYVTVSERSAQWGIRPPWYKGGAVEVTPQRVEEPSRP